MVRAYEAAAAADPTSRKALIGIANARILLATGYTSESWEKAERYQKVMQAAEKALLLNNDFRRQVEAGTPVWEAVSRLGKDDADGMGYWSFGACYYYREGIPSLARAWNFQWIERARVFMRRSRRSTPP